MAARLAMERENLVKYIQQVFPLPTEVAIEIAAHFSELEIAKNDFLLKNGKICNEYMYIDAGFMRAFTLNADGDEVTTGFYATNEVVFEVASFFQRTPSMENIQAVVDTHGWCINFEQLQFLFHSLPEFREFGRTVLVKGFVSLKQRMLLTINETAEKRYELLLNTRPEVFQMVPLKNIASYLGVTDTSLSRIRKEFAHKQ